MIFGTMGKTDRYYSNNYSVKTIYMSDAINQTDSVETVQRLQDFQHRLLNNKGHKHLYAFFDKIYANLKEKESLYPEEIDAVVDTVIKLKYEAMIYFYPSYSLKCMDCAERLNSIINNSLLSKDIRELKESHIEKNFWNFSHTEKFRSFVNELKEISEYDKILNIIRSCFAFSDSGRRPRNLDIEIQMNYLVTFGHDLLDWYLIQTNNTECFAGFCEYIDILHLQNIYESFDHIAWREEANCIVTSIKRHLHFYQKWVAMNPKTFLETNDEDFIHQLLELYDDNAFFVLLNHISRVNSNKVLHVLEYYKDDDEQHIRITVNKIINNINYDEIK
jgi:hypothetical protein